MQMFFLFNCIYLPSHIERSLVCYYLPLTKFKIVERCASYSCIVQQSLCKYTDSHNMQHVGVDGRQLLW